MSDRKDITAALDSSLAPTLEFDLVPLAIGAEDTELDLTDADKFAQDLEGFPLVLLVQSDVDFVEGAAAPDVAANLPRAKDTIHSLCVNGRTKWHFKAATAGTIKGKLLAAL